MRRLKVMAVVGDGQYPLHPVHVEDMARLCVEAGFDLYNQGEYDWDACNPELTSYVEMLEMMKREMGISCLIVKHVP